MSWPIYCTDELIQPLFNRLPKLPTELLPSRKRYQSEEYLNFRTNVLRRDDFTCQICGLRSRRKTKVHHINSYSKYPHLRNIIENGVSLCPDCHSEFHEIYGYKNNVKDQFIEFQKHKQFTF